MTDEAHKQFIELLLALKGQVVLSGYQSPLYSEVLEKNGWRRVDKQAVVNSGGSRIESLWLSPTTVVQSVGRF